MVFFEGDVHPIKSQKKTCRARAEGPCKPCASRHEDQGGSPRIQLDCRRQPHAPPAVPSQGQCLSCLRTSWRSPSGRAPRGPGSSPPRASGRSATSNSWCTAGRLPHPQRRILLAFVFESHPPQCEVTIQVLSSNPLLKIVFPLGLSCYWKSDCPFSGR